MMKLMPILLILSPVSSFAQMISPSVFPEMRVYNPAVISQRKSGNIRMSVLNDNIKKTQDLPTLNGSAFGASESSKISFNDGTFFRGGKGGGLTTEMLVDYCTGKRTTDLTSSGGSSSTVSTNASSSFASFAMGAGFFGLQAHYVEFKSSYEFKQTFNGTAYNDSISQKTTVMGLRPGFVFGGPALSIGIIGEYDKMESKSINNSTGANMDSGSPSAMKYVGFAIGTSGGNSMLEVAVEADPFTKQQVMDQSTGEKSPMPMKASLLAEIKFSSLTLGYKGSAYKGMYIELDKIIPTQMVYQNPGSEMRLEHVFNFSFGGSSGMSFGGSASYSNATKKEKSSYFMSSDKYDTKVTEFGASLKVSYVY